MTSFFVGDESGTRAFSILKSETRYFVITLVSFDDPNAVRSLVLDFIRANGLEGNELSVHSISSESMRIQFFERLGSMNFTVWALIVDKKRLEPAYKFASRTNLYIHFLCEAIRIIPLVYRQGGGLVLKQISPKEKMRFQLARNLKISNIKRGFKKIVIEHAADELLIQIADLIAGAVYWHTTKDESQMYEMMGDKIVLSEFPPLRTSQISERKQMQVSGKAPL